MFNFTNDRLTIRNNPDLFLDLYEDRKTKFFLQTKTGEEITLHEEELSSALNDIFFVSDDVEYEYIETENDEICKTMASYIITDQELVNLAIVSIKKVYGDFAITFVAPERTARDTITI